MDADFWHQRWQANQIGFHQSRVNALLAAFVKTMNLAPGAGIFVPLCGKTLDIAWLREQGYRVLGAELSEIAIRQLFEEMALAPEVTLLGKVTRYAAKDIEIFVGDIFDLNAETLGPVDAVYDRAALVALPPEMRMQYAQHMVGLTRHAPQLLITFEYDQSVMSGPPFSVTAGEVARLYGNDYRLKSVKTRAVEGGLKGICPADESLWMMTRT